MELAALLVNELDVGSVRGREVAPPADGRSRRAAVLEASGRLEQPPRGSLTESDADALAGVAAGLRPLFGGGPEAIASLNALLVRHGAVANLHGEPPRLAFHQPEASLVDAWAADTGTALAMVIGVGQGVRLRSCEADGCSLVFFDVTRNASRRFCGLSCQNRAKASAYRARRRA